MNNKRVIIVSNRLPVKVSKVGGIRRFVPSEGGLATGLSSVAQNGDNLWIGWPGADIAESEQQEVIDELNNQSLHPIFLSKKEIANFYEGFSNETLWPLFHYFPSYITYNPEYWDDYYAVNKKFADSITSIATNDDIIWIHDYQLMLVPEMVRKVLPDVSIGFFQHIPFPSFELFRSLPWRKEVLRGMLGADVIGFHTYDDVRHFLSSTNRIINVQGAGNELRVDNRLVTVDAFPMGIDYQKFSQLADDKVVKQHERKIKKLIDNKKLIISIDRLDYSKGIVQRLLAYQLFLERYPECRGKMTMLQLVVPSRDNVPKYKELKEEMNRLISEINGRFGKLDWQPIRHFYRSFPDKLLSALYRAADVALVTPLRDGMNLVSKEFVASKTDGKGVLILSETAGASRELSDALIINPNDIWDYAETINYALNMPEDKQKKRMQAMQQIVSRFDVFTWVENFMSKLEEAKQKQAGLTTKLLKAETYYKVKHAYDNANKRLIFLDYDGTLVPFKNQVNAAVPDSDLKLILKALTRDPDNTIVLTSGRDYQTLQSWLGELKIDIIAEHGAWYRDHGKEWHNRRDLNNDWRSEVYGMMDKYVRRTPGSSIEEKSYSLVWHYRRVEEGLGNLRTSELMQDIKHIIADRGLHMLQGDKVLEIKSLSVNKGKAAQRWLAKDNFDFIMAIGDDYTDEDTFRNMPAGAHTIKVGSSISEANYFVSSYVDVRNLLATLVIK
ncbi:MAG: bifunctional alpha,alpha-trehalose-phosphate synthase (UDP-forming)/trehalose-phosphatase [Sphingobacteriales bacterium]|nr:MAG: bifunctional alpha,alpha-trehalose-phosphate synthase (UDP-forming)/trehalose-phosphatase [Sphingobacteriales bacterium]